jgi:chromosome segregation ATPase
MNKTTEELQKELNELKKENKDLLARRKEIKDELIIIEERLGKLNTMWNNQGEIDRKQREVEDSKWPIYSEKEYYIERITKVTEKYVTIKSDRRDKGTDYNRSNGWRKGIKSGYATIDVEKAMDIWNKHNESK